MNIDRNAMPLMKLHCPVCGHAARIRTSRPMSETTRDLFMECGNQQCRAVFQAMVEVTKIIGESLLNLDLQSEASPRLLHSRRPGRRKGAAVEQPAPAEP